MKIAIVPNAFKGSLTASQAAGCIERGFRKALLDFVAKKPGTPVIAICGSLSPDAGKVRAHGIRAFVSALEEPVAEADLPRRAPGMLERCAEQMGYLLALKAAIPS